MTAPIDEGAWGDGLATVTEAGRVLDTWFPAPALGSPDGVAARGTRELGINAAPPDLAAAARRDERRGVRSIPVRTVIESLAQPPGDAHDAYLRLHLLSHRLIRPHEADL